jgi:hypothetical protein
MRGLDPEVTQSQAIEYLNTKMSRNSSSQKKWNSVVKTLITIDRCLEEYILLEQIEKIGIKQLSKFYSPYEDISNYLLSISRQHEDERPHPKVQSSPYHQSITVQPIK